MSDNFGLRLGIDGEKDFKNALRDINQSFKVLGSEMVLVTSEFDKNDRSVEAVTARNKVLTKEIDAQKDKISTLKSALENASSSFGETDKRTQNWQIQLNKAQAELNGMEREIKQNNEALDNAANGFDDAEKQADQFGDEVKKAGKESEDTSGKLEKLGGIAKGVGAALAASFAAIGTAAIGAGKALADMTVQGAAYADSVITTSTQTGIATDKLQEYMYAAELVDVSTETLTKSMTKQIKSMKSASDGSKTMVAAYETLGVSIKNSDGTLRDSDTVYWETIDALGKMKNETERDALAMQILGKSAQELNPLIEAGAGRMQELGQQAQQAGYVIGEEMLNAYGALDDNIQYLKVNAEGAKNALGTVLLPVLTELSGTGSNLLAEFTKGISDANGDLGKMSDVIGGILPKALDAIMQYVPELLELAGSVIGALGQAIIDNLPQLVESASQIVMTLLNGIIDALPQLADGAIQLVLTLVSGIIDALPQLIEAALQIVITLANGISEALPTLIPQVVQTVITIVKTLLDNLPMLIEAALQIVIALAEGIGAALPELVAAVPQILSSIVTSIIGSLPLLLPAAIDIVFALIEGILGALPELIAAVPNLIMGIVQGILDNLPTIILYAPEIIVSLITGLIGAIPQLVMAIPQIITSIVETFRGYDWSSVGTNIMQGLTNGISGMVAKIREKIREVCQNVINTFKKMFGINSPSTVFAGFGKNLLEGLWNGIQNVKSWLINKIRSLGSAVTEALKSVLGIHSPSKVFENEIGVNLGLGVGIGFEKSMKQVSEDMQKAIPTDFDVDANIKSSIGTASHGFGGIQFTLRIENFYNNTLQDIKELAEEISVVLASEVSRKAEAF